MLLELFSTLAVDLLMCPSCLACFVCYLCFFLLKVTLPIYLREWISLLLPEHLIADQEFLACILNKDSLSSCRLKIPTSALLFHPKWHPFAALQRKPESQNEESGASHLTLRPCCARCCALTQRSSSVASHSNNRRSEFSHLCLALKACLSAECVAQCCCLLITQPQCLCSHKSPQPVNFVKSCPHI